MARPTRTPREAVIELAVDLARCPRHVHSDGTTLELTKDVARKLDVFLLEYAGENSW